MLTIMEQKKMNTKHLIRTKDGLLSGCEQTKSCICFWNQHPKQNMYVPGWDD